MPYTEEFKRLRRRFNNQYSDKAKADGLAYEKAIALDIPTFEERRRKLFKKQGQSSLAGILYFFMALVIMFLFMPTLRVAITNGIANLSSNMANYTIITLIIRFYPVFLVIMLMVILAIIMRR